MVELAAGVSSPAQLVAELKMSRPESQGVGDDTGRGEGHGSGGDHRGQQEPERGVECAGGDPGVARQTRALFAQPGAAQTPDARPARARVRTRIGRWLVVRGSVLGEDPDAPVAVTLESAGPAELAPLMAEAYGLTPGERRVTELVAQGLTTKQIADRLHLSAYTVQDHLKSVFTKSGTSSRGDLTARLFFDYYASSLTSGPGRS